MAEGRHSLDRLQRKKDNSLLRMFILAFLPGNSDNSAKCLVQQRQRRAQQHDEQNLACHSAGLSVHGILTDIELDSPAGHLAKPKHVCLLRSFLAQISNRHRWIATFTTKKENHKNMTVEW
jgi:hypothetical protein